MKYLPNIAGALLGILFLLSSVPFLFHLMKMPEMPAGTPKEVITFMDLFMSTGYMTFVKVFELIGGVLVAIPRTRNFGLLALGPIILNILAFTGLVAKGGFGNPMLIVAVVLATYLLWVGRKAFASLLN